MKSVLIIDELPLFREYLRLKLSDNHIEVSIGINAIDGISKMRAWNPDLIIINYHLSKKGCLDVLKEKKLNRNSVLIPVVIMAQQIDQKKLVELIPYNIAKIFAQAVKIDVLFSTLSEILQVPIKVDKSPGIVEVHANDDIIFIEISLGLNEDKLELLKYKIIELTNLYEIRVPKVVVMMSNMRLTHADTPNMQKLMETVFYASKAKPYYIRMLTKDDFIEKFLKDQEIFAEILVSSNLNDAVEGLLAGLQNSDDDLDMDAELLGVKILSAGKLQDETEEMVALKFESEPLPKGLDMEQVQDMVQNLKIASVDDDIIIQNMIKNTFSNTKADVFTYSDGEEFLSACEKEEFDLVFLDMLMPKIDGFAVLNTLRKRKYQPPIVILSTVKERETVLKAFQMGIKSYLIKPMKPEDIYKKTIEILKVNF